jgi:hypothetical protein
VILESGIDYLTKEWKIADKENDIKYEGEDYD